MFIIPIVYTTLAHMWPSWFIPNASDNGMDWWWWCLKTANIPLHNTYYCTYVHGCITNTWIRVIYMKANKNHICIVGLQMTFRPTSSLRISQMPLDMASETFTMLVISSETNVCCFRSWHSAIAAERSCHAHPARFPPDQAELCRQQYLIYNRYPNVGLRAAG